MDAALLEKAKEYALTGEGSGYIVRHGKLVLRWGDPKAKYDLKSTTKGLRQNNIYILTCLGPII
jgi:hypothetical protein